MVVEEEGGDFKAETGFVLGDIFRGGSRNPARTGAAAAEADGVEPAVVVVVTEETEAGILTCCSLILLAISSLPFLVGGFFLL